MSSQKHFLSMYCLSMYWVQLEELTMEYTVADCKVTFVGFIHLLEIMHLEFAAVCGDLNPMNPLAFGVAVERPISQCEVRCRAQSI